MYFGYLYFELYSHADLFEAENAQEEEEESKMNLWTAIGALIGVTVVTAFCADYLVDSIDEFSTKLGVPKVFIGFILLPIGESHVNNSIKADLALQSETLPSILQLVRWPLGLSGQADACFQSGWP